MRNDEIKGIEILETKDDEIRVSEESTIMNALLFVE